MTEQHPELREPRRQRRRAPLIVALVLFGLMGAFWFLAIGSTAAVLFYTFGWREGVLVGGGLIALTALLAELRVGVFEAIFECIYGIGALILGAIGVIVSAILELFIW